MRRWNWNGMGNKIMLWKKCTWKGVVYWEAVVALLLKHQKGKWGKKVEYDTWERIVNWESSEWERERQRV